MIKNKTFRYFFLFFLTAVIVAFDQITKYLVSSNMKLGDEITVIPRFFKLYYVRNKGAGLGILQNARWVFLTVTTIVIVVVILLLVLDKFKNLFADISLVFILAGGIGNMIDRTAFGEVIDFFQFQIKLFDFIFNVADIFVTFGTIMFVIYYLFIYGKKDAERDNEQN